MPISRFFTFLCHSLPYFCHNSPLRHLIIHYKNFYVALKKFHLGVAKTLQILNKRLESKRIINFRGCRKGVARPSQGCRKGVAFSDKIRTSECWIILRRRKGHLRHPCDGGGVAKLCLISATLLPHSGLNWCCKNVSTWPAFLELGRMHVGVCLFHR